MCARLILLRGNSGSGKSTTARELQRRLGRGTLIIAQDIVRREMLWAKDGPDSSAIPPMIELARYGSRNCETVIVEGILDSAAYAPLFAVLNAEYPQIFAYYYDLPFEETLRRHQTKPNRDQFGEADMRRWWKERDLIGSISEKIITLEQSQADTVSMILHDIER